MKHTFCQLLTAVVLFSGLFAISAAAQEPSATYVVHLAHRTQWGPATLAPGIYTVASQLPYPMLTVSGRGITLNDGKHPEAVFLTASAMHVLRGNTADTAVVLNVKGAADRVASMRLADPGVELRFEPPAALRAATGTMIAARP